LLVKVEVRLTNSTGLRRRTRMHREASMLISGMFTVHVFGGFQVICIPCAPSHQCMMFAFPVLEGGRPSAGCLGVAKTSYHLDVSRIIKYER
jgi:hypothetical protein